MAANTLKRLAAVVARTEKVFCPINDEMHVALADDPGFGCGADKSNLTELRQRSQRRCKQRSSTSHASREHHKSALSRLLPQVNLGASENVYRFLTPLSDQFVVKLRWVGRW